VERIREQVGSERVLCALSGGVDSAVAALLVHKAVGDQLTCVFVDHGLLRKDEAAQVVETFRGHFRVPLVHVDAADRFLTRLEGVTDPEEKRRRVGEEFIRVFEAESRRLGRIRYLVQGTLYSDVIESGGSEDGVAAKIKSHHNVGGLPDEMEMELVEPLRLLFKDEVRRVGAELGLPARKLTRAGQLFTRRSLIFFQRHDDGHFRHMLIRQMLRESNGRLRLLYDGRINDAWG